jgi:hypothetical protein
VAAPADHIIDDARLLENKAELLTILSVSVILREQETVERPACRRQIRGRAVHIDRDLRS